MNEIASSLADRAAAGPAVALPEGPVAVTSRPMQRDPTLAALLGQAPMLARRGVPEAAEAVLGWGRRPSGDAAERLARSAGRRWLRVEDGFLRSVGRSEAPLSLVFDDAGIYYDGGAPSALEAAILRGAAPAEAARARDLAALWREGRLSKYNAGRDYAGPLPERYALLVDQVAGDASIGFGLADAAAFRRMLEAALAETDLPLLLKVHPDATWRRRAGHFDLAALDREARVRVVSEPCHPARLLEGAERVYTVTSQMGFEALLWGRSVRCFGMPFYAGWGLTEDALPAPGRRRKVPLAALVHAALALYPAYVDPETGAPCPPETAFAHVALQRRMRERFPPRVHAVGFSPRKRPALRRFLAGSEVKFQRRDPVPEAKTAVVWSRREAPAGAGAVLRVEDGFLRSRGLGADLTAPVSWAIDDLGIYFDAEAPSRLESILAAHPFPPELLARAGALRRRITALGITKYNLGGGGWQRPAGAARVVLVPGQVEADASIRHGAAGVRTNLALLRAARAEEPGAYLVYKPHPDVVAGLRRRGSDEAQAASLADAVVTKGDAAAMLGAVDAVHTITSLTGFEALLRGVQVVCHGRPFYAGWGLTADRAALPRRGRALPLDALVAAALILYPTYVSRVTGRFTTPERAVEELALWRAAPPVRRSLAAQTLRGVLRAWSATIRRDG